MDIQTLIILQIIFDFLLIMMVFFFRQGTGKKIDNLLEIKDLISSLEKQNKEREEITATLSIQIEKKQRDLKDLLFSLEVKEKNILNNLSSNDPFLEAPRFLRQGFSIEETAKKVGLPEEDIRLISELIKVGKNI